MKTTLRVASFTSIIFGFLAILGSLVPYAPYGVLGGVMFATQGALALIYIDQEDKKVKA